MINWLDIAAVAYRAYTDSIGKMNHQVELRARLADLPDDVKAAWVAATQAAVREAVNRILASDLVKR